jgi:hypothetical protein
VRTGLDHWVVTVMGRRLGVEKWAAILLSLVF